MTAIAVVHCKDMNSDQPAKLEGTKLANFTPAGPVTELQIIDVAPGNGDVVPEGATITAHYTGALVSDGTIFQSSHDFGDAISFGLNQVIEGWTKGVPGMKVGGTRRLIIPAAMAYGERSPSANIPPNSDLVFDIELVKIN
jgi:peptidylprolyl isomerase